MANNKLLYLDDKPSEIRRIMTMRSGQKNSYFTHLLLIVGFFALWGFVSTHNDLILMGVAASFSGAVCGSFILVIDTIKSKK